MGSERRTASPPGDNIMRKLPIAYRDLVRELRDAGFARAWTRGTHEIWKHDALPEHVKVPFPPGGSDRMLNGRLPLQALQAIEHARAVAPPAVRALPPVIEIPPALPDIALTAHEIQTEPAMMIEHQPGITKTARAKQTAAQHAKTDDPAREFAEAWAAMKQREVAEYFGITQLDVQLLVQHWKLPRHKQRGSSRNGPVRIIRRETPRGEGVQRACAGCGALFPAHRNQRYHSPACRKEQWLRRRTQRRHQPAPGQASLRLNDASAPYTATQAPPPRAALPAAVQPASPAERSELDYELLAAQVAAQQARVPAIHIDYERLAEAMVRLQVKMFLAWREKERGG